MPAHPDHRDRFGVSFDAAANGYSVYDRHRDATHFISSEEMAAAPDLITAFRRARARDRDRRAFAQAIDAGVQRAVDEHDTRRCTRCERRQDAENFRWLGGQERFHPWCRPCEAENRRERALRNPVEREQPVGSRVLGLNRRFGIEIEFNLPHGGTRQSVGDALAVAGLTIKYDRYHDVEGPHWRLKSDGSLGPRGLELVSPPMQGEEGLRQLKVALQTLREHGCSVSRACGLHVHLEVRDLRLEGMKRFIRSWFENQSLLNWLVSASRRNGSRYCRALTNGEMSAIDMASSRRALGRAAPRYRTVNVQAYPKHGTLEMRQHQGTLNYKKIEKWLLLCMGMMDAVAQRDAHIERQPGLREFMEEIETLDPADRRYLQSRARALGYRQPEEVAA